MCQVNNEKITGKCTGGQNMSCLRGANMINHISLNTRKRMHVFKVKVTIKLPSIHRKNPNNQYHSFTWEVLRELICPPIYYRFKSNRIIPSQASSIPGTQLPSIHKTFIYGNHIFPLSVLILLAHSAGCILILQLHMNLILITGT